ncbi:hypothetical protein MBRU_07125 [Mycolicibacterium brumae DSM 44177]|nr:hypothetical protein MBRU_07125 [Mycolicibacterium brumae DSM 44177]
MQYVEDPRHAFAYTVGLHARGLAELVVTGVTAERAVMLLNGIADYCVKRVQPKPGETMTLPGGIAEFVQVRRPDVHLLNAIRIYGPEVCALQVVWADRRGHWPWCPDFDGGRGSQPVLGARVVRGDNRATRRRRSA